MTDTGLGLEVLIAMVSEDEISLTCLSVEGLVSSVSKLVESAVSLVDLDMVLWLGIELSLLVVLLLRLLVWLGLGLSLLERGEVE